MIPYVVWSYDYSHASAGPKVLHRLVHELNQAGQEAYVGPWLTNPAWDTPTSGPLEGEWIAVYPEVVVGNPWNAPHVVRWVLNKPGKLGGELSYAASERVFAYSRTFIDAPLLTLHAVETDIYTDRHEPRQGAAVYVGKGTETQAILGATRITLDMRLDRHALADVLNRVGVLYSFDAVSGMNDIARLCGCPVVLITEMRRDELDMDWTGVGLGYVPPPFDAARFRDSYLARRDIFLEQLRAFIDITQAAVVAA